MATLVRVVYPRVATYASAQAFLDAYHGQPGCLLVDVAMPEMSGLDLHQRLLQAKVQLPVVFITAYGNVAMAVQAMRLGAVDFLEKPVQEQSLWDSIRRAIELDKRTRRRQGVVSTPKSNLLSSLTANARC